MAKKQLELPSDFFFFVKFLLRTTSKCVAHPARHSVHTFSLRALPQKKSEGKTCTFPQKRRFRPIFRRSWHGSIWCRALPERLKLTTSCACVRGGRACSRRVGPPMAPHGHDGAQTHGDVNDQVTNFSDIFCLGDTNRRFSRAFQARPPA